jgi:hypothetical protein
MSLKPICVHCQRFYRPRKTGYQFIEGMPMNDGAVPGNSAAENWKPYKLWSGDLWKCDGCDHLIIVGVARASIDEHFSPTFKQTVESYEKEHGGPLLQINDC